MAERRGHGTELEITDDDHAQGAAPAPVTLVEYGDFECPYSREAVKTIQVLQREFGGELRFVFRHFPLAEKHPHAIQAAEASESCRRPGRVLVDVCHVVCAPMGARVQRSHGLCGAVGAG